VVIVSATASHGYAGLVQLSDQARQQLVHALPKRSAWNTFAVAALPFTESCEPRAGIKVL
jgi:hypothetical protein